MFLEKGTPVGPVAGMGERVSRQAAGLREGVATCCKYVGTVADVHAKVCRQVASFRKGLPVICQGCGRSRSPGANVRRQVVRHRAPAGLYKRPMHRAL